MENKTTELLPCPFCGGKAKMETNHCSPASVYIGCNKCGCGTGIYEASVGRCAMLDAIDAWNRRDAKGGGKVDG